MSKFKDMVAIDNRKVFLNADELGECRTIIYDGMSYSNIPVSMSAIRESSRKQLVSDHIQGLYLVSVVMHCIATDIGGILPEKGTHIKINDKKGGEFFYEFTVASSSDVLGLLRLELEALDE